MHLLKNEYNFAWPIDILKRKHVVTEEKGIYFYAEQKIFKDSKNLYF